MEIKTTKDIWKDFCNQLDLEVLEVGAKTKVEGWCRVYQEESKDKKWIAYDDLIKHIDIEMSYDETNEREFNVGAYHSLKKLRDKLLELKNGNKEEKLAIQNESNRRSMNKNRY